MRLGRRLVSSALGLVVVAAPTLTGCGLWDRGSTVEEAFEYLPADTFSVRFSDRGAMAERLGVDDIDPRDASEATVDDYFEELSGDEAGAVATSELARWLRLMRDAPLNELDVEWQAVASWDGPDGARGATVWKVGDDVDFEALADDLVAKGYDESGSSDAPIYTAYESESAPVGGVYPPWMVAVLLDADEHVVVAAAPIATLRDIAEVIADDADSLADDGGMNDLVRAADDEPETAWLVTGSEACTADGAVLSETARDDYDDLGRPEGRALFTHGESRSARLALQFDDESEAEDDLEARQRLIDDGVEALTSQPFDELGDFEIEQDGELVVIDEDFDGGLSDALEAERDGGGPGACLADITR